MDSTADQIETHIERTRDNLESNIQELEDKVKSLGDWRYHYEKSPGLLLGAAFVGGFLFAALTGGRRSRPASLQAVPDHHVGNGKAHEAWEIIKSALVGVAAKRAIDYVGELVPGFREHVGRADARRESLE